MTTGTSREPHDRGKRTPRWLRIVELTAWTVGIALLVVWLGARIHRAVNHRRDLQRFEEARREAAAVPQPARVEEPSLDTPALDLQLDLPVDTSLWSKGRIEGYEESLEEDFDLPLGVLRIEKIGLEVVILEGTDELTLNRGLGWIPGTALPGEAGNMAVAGHRDGFFRGLKDVERGDHVELESLQGSATYVIDAIHIVSPEDVWVLEPRDSPTLTLVTCYPFYFVGKAPKRYIVQASLQSAI